jgi:hypothetical protein
MHQGLAIFRATGTELSQVYFLSILAEMYGNAGQTEGGSTKRKRMNFFDQIARSLYRSWLGS